MVTAIQLIAAGVLLVAWLWALGRPVAAGKAGTPWSEEHGRGQLDSSERDSGGARRSTIGNALRLPRQLTPWRRRPLVYRRRQLMLATMFAAFGSFFLAVALRGRFFQLFLLMMAVLIGHLGVASHVGSKLVRLERARRVAAARSRRRSGGPAIRAPQAGLGFDPSRLAFDIPMPEDLVPPSHGVFDQPRRSPFSVAMELASLLENTDELDRAADANRIFVSDLIEHEWGSGSDADGGGNEAEPAETQASEPIFTRAAKRRRSRSRRKSRPIHIHSHLDEADGVPRKRAVNDS
jgi:hypothetical protein